MAYNRRLIFPTDDPSLITIGSNLFSGINSTFQAIITGSSNFVSSSTATAFFRYTGSYYPFASSSNIPVTNTDSTNGYFSGSYPTTVSDLSTNTVFESYLKIFGQKQVGFTTNAIIPNWTVNVTATYATAASYVLNGVSYKAYRFLQSDTLTIDRDSVVDVLAVGGGGGGNGYAGGGGGGEVAFISSYVLPAGTYSLVIGAGGAGSTNNGGDTKGGDGTVTTLFGETIRVGGGGLGSDNTAAVGSNVSNGGGGGSRSVGHVGTIGTNVSINFTRYGGNDGGRGAEASNYPGAGGAGAGANSVDRSGGQSGGAGGSGVQVGLIYDGINNYYWGGGGGGSAYYNAAGGDGGAGGGGAGSGPGGSGTADSSGINTGTTRSNVNSDDGGANTGGGAGSGGGNSGAPTVAANGGSGIVVIAFRV